MAIETDFEIDVGGNITHVANTNHYTVLELHRWLQSLADDAAPAAADDIVDITSLTPSERSTDEIITLLNGFNIDDDASEYFYGGSISQLDGDTVYSGLRVLGAVNNPNTQLQIMQDDDYYNTTSPFWGDQSGGGYNGNAVAGILVRVLVKSREFGADINQKKARVQARTWGDSYDFFDVTLGQGEAVAAVGTTPDAQSIAIGTVQGWAGGDIPTNTEGWQLIDILNGNNDKEYYSKWTYNTNILLMKAIWLYIKEITGNDSPEAADPHGRNGELFLGITHSWAYGALTGTFTEDEIVYWGTDITYTGLAGGVFSVGDYVVFKDGGVIINAGKVLYDNGTTQFIVALEDSSGSILADGNTIEEASAGSVTAAIDTAGITDDDLGGGEGVLYAENEADDDMYVQLIHGVAPVDTQIVWGRSSVADTVVSGSVTIQTVPKIFLGSYTGSLIGAFGIGIDDGDLLSTDSVQPLVGPAQDPPNNVTFSLSAIEVGEDRILIGKKDTGNVFDWEEMTLAIALNGAETTVDVGSANIPADAPASGVLRITLDDGVIRRVPYSAHDGDKEFTINDTFPSQADVGKGVMIAFIDKLAASDPEEFILQFAGSRTLWIRVRDGAGTPIKTYEAQATLGTTGGSAVASRITDE